MEVSSAHPFSPQADSWPADLFTLEMPALAHQHRRIDGGAPESVGGPNAQSVLIRRTSLNRKIARCIRKCLPPSLPLRAKAGRFRESQGGGLAPFPRSQRHSGRQPETESAQKKPDSILHQEATSSSLGERTHSSFSEDALCHNSGQIECQRKCREFGTFSGASSGAFLGSFRARKWLMSRAPAPRLELCAQPAAAPAAVPDPSPPPTWVEGSAPAAVVIHFK